VSDASPFFSVIIPVLDGGRDFELCLQALAASSWKDRELVVVDDGSSDESAEAARASGARVLTTGGPLGPAAARNLGAAEARGAFLFFLDADCTVHPDTLELAASALQRESELDALFGSYDDRPAAPGAVSQFKNLFHHWVHQGGDPDASTFWAGCGVVRRSAFEAVGGFDASLYDRPAIEDIELGYRLRDAGSRIRLAPQVQVCHLKRWTLGRLIVTDVFQRGVPWTRLLQRRGKSRELNLDWRGRASVALVLLALTAVVLALVEPRLLVLAGAATAVVLLLNYRLYCFFAAKRGVVFLVAAVPLHLLYCAYSGFAYALGRLTGVARV
jgi:GT2 family glycosyltransferase